MSFKITKYYNTRVTINYNFEQRNECLRSNYLAMDTLNMKYVVKL